MEKEYFHPAAFPVFCPLCSISCKQKRGGVKNYEIINKNFIFVDCVTQAVYTGDDGELCKNKGLQGDFMFIVPITKMDSVIPSDQVNVTPGGKTAQGPQFKDMLKAAVREADQAIKDTQEMDVNLAAGQVDNLHTALIQAEKSAAAIEFTTQLTSKAVNAYNQIMGMQI